MQEVTRNVGIVARSQGRVLVKVGLVFSVVWAAGYLARRLFAEWHHQERPST